MTYRKANRHLTEEQFSEGTTIDGTRIDKALDDMVDHHNDIPKGDFQGRWMPVTYVMSWTPSRPRWRGTMTSAAATLAGAPSWCNARYCYGQANHWFPWMVTRNWQDEIYPNTYSPTIFGHPEGIQNEWRHKGFFHNKMIRGTPGGVPVPAATPQALPDESIEASSRNVYTLTPTDVQVPNNLQSGPWGQTYGNWDAPLLFKHMASTVPMFFHKPVIITGVSVYGASDHPYNFYSSQKDRTLPALNPYARIEHDGDKGAIPTAVQKYESACYQELASTQGAPADFVFLEGDLQGGWYGARVGITGNEFPGEKFTNAPDVRGNQKGGENFGNGTIEISIDNEFNKEKRLLNDIAFKKWDMGVEAQKFNFCPPTSNESGAAAAGGGTNFTDMQPAWLGGPHWGVWVKEDKLNIPISRDSRVRFAVITQGMRNTQLFEWHMAITVLEEIE